MKDDRLISAAEAAKELGVSKRRVIALINADNPDRRLPAERVGNSYVIRASDLERVRVRPKGRPSRGRAE